MARKVEFKQVKVQIEGEEPMEFRAERHIALDILGMVACLRKRNNRYQSHPNFKEEGI